LEFYCKSQRMDKLFFLLLLFNFQFVCYAQEEVNYPEKEKSPNKINFKKEGTSNVRFVTLMQTWVRAAQLNPGSFYKEEIKSSVTDISVRRIVFTTIAQLSPNALVLLNLEGSSNSGDNAFQPGLDVGVLDAYGEYKFNKHFYVGAGLHQWTGLSRLNVDGVGSVLNLDQPLFQQATWNKLDRLGRVMGIYAKGDIGKFNYRLSVNEPFKTEASAFTANSGKGSPSGNGLNSEAKNAQVNVAYHNPTTNSKLMQGYFEYAFWQTENHVSPYEINTYHGEKKLLNIGTGFFYRRNGMFTPANIELKNTSLPESSSNPKLVKSGNETDLFCYAVDAILMYPFTKKQDGITAYAAYYHFNLGNNYYTVSAINNITTAGTGASAINAAGTAFPTTGTGNAFYTKLGYITPNNWLGKLRVGLFGTYQHSKIEALKDAVQVYEAGVNCFINTNKIKLTTMYRSRPVYTGTAAYANVQSTAVVSERKGEWITQLQFNF
jgi:hypothetical protein